MKSALIAAAGLILAVSTTATALAQSSYPNRPITIIVNITPASGTDLIARTMADEMKNALKRPIVVENRPGAGGSVGAAVIASSEPDGYRLLVTSSALTALPAIQPNLAFDPQNDLTPIIPLAFLPAVVMASADKGIRNIAELVDRARKAPGEVTFSSSGIASASHIEVERMRAAAKIKLTHVPYRGAPEAILEVAAGRVDFVIAPLVAGRPFIDAGQLRAIAVTSTRRSALIPDVPTMAESGLDTRFGAWVGLLGPKNMPAELVRTIYDAAKQALESPEVKQKFELLAAEAMPMTSAEFKNLINDEIISNRELLAETTATDRK